ncbi:MAG: LPS assembly protein LptD [Lysobacterales bacterium]
MTIPDRLLQHAALALAIAVIPPGALAADPAVTTATAAGAAQSTSRTCPIGVLKCPKPKLDWSTCRRNALLDFYVPGLPVEGDRESTPADASATQVKTLDKDRYVLEGDAQLERLDQLLRADTLTYDDATTDYSATGHVRYQDRGLLASADAAHGRTEPEQANLTGVNYQLLTSRGNGKAATANVTDPDHGDLTDATYSTCDPGDHTWELRADTIHLDQDEGVGRARDVTFALGGVPVFWLPYLRFPLTDERESGFLAPDIGYSNRRGFEFELPYYLNLAPNYDATIYPRLMTDRGLMLGGEFRYATESSTGSFVASILPDDHRADDESAEFGTLVPSDRWSYQWKDTTAWSQNWGASVDINHVSDDHYFEDFGHSLTRAATSMLPASAYIVGRGTWWTAAIGGDSYQITDPTLPSAYLPYRRLPRVTFNADAPVAGELEAGLDSEYVAFTKDDKPEGQRLDLFPYLTLPIETAAYFLRPKLGYRFTTYDLDASTLGGSPALTRTRPDRGLPIFSLDTGLVFDRSLTLGGEAMTQTLEPRAYYLWVPYRDQTDLPVFDTQSIPFSFSELFRSNRYIGADRQMDANNLSLALTSRLLSDSTGDEIVSASIGQIRYFSDQRVQLPGAPPTDYAGSTYAGELDLHLGANWRVTLDQQWNPNTDQIDLSTFTVQNRFGDGGLVNFSYRYRRNLIDQVDVSALVPITPKWRLIARDNFAIHDPVTKRDHETLERFIGVEHDTCCLTWRVLARRYIHDIQGDADSALYFEIEFKGIGAIGQASDNFLRRGILGFQ